jgi:hypothetical protein
MLLVASQVYKAMWRGTAVAVKVLKEHGHLELGLAIVENPQQDKDFKDKERDIFEQEAELLATFRHPNIVNFLGFSISADTVRFKERMWIHTIGFSF